MGFDVEGFGAPYGPEVGPDVCGALVESPDVDARRQSRAEGEGHAARQPDLAVDRQPVPPLWVRCVDATESSGHSLRALRR